MTDKSVSADSDGAANSDLNSPPLRAAMIGCGTVGTGVLRILGSATAGRITHRSGREIQIERLVVRNQTRERDVDLSGISVSNSIDSVLSDDSITVVIEVMGGVEPAREIVTRILQSGKDVITANKALIHAHGAELFELAQRQKRTICFEAAVAGGIPVINAINQSLTGNQIQSIEAILNGTSNFILSRMLDEDRSYEEVLSEAQQLGYAEADPAMDVDGTDAAQKLSILTYLSFGKRVPLADFVIQGIQDIQLLDLQAARDLGYRVKLLATTRLTGGALEMAVQPTLVRSDRSVAQTSGADNIIAIEGDAVGMIRLSGAGAGQMPTASAVVADLVDYATGRAALTFESLVRQSDQPPIQLLPREDLSRRYYLRFTVADEPHVLADVADILGRHQISISSVHQDETPEHTDEGTGAARLLIMTHRTTEGRMARADAEVQQLKSMLGTSIRMPVAD